MTVALSAVMLRILCMLLLTASVAHAERFAFGVAFGKGSDESAAFSTRALSGRLRIADHVSVFGELGRAYLDDDKWAARRGLVGARLDLSRGRWQPFIAAALGGERWTGGSFHSEADYTVREAGIGLEVALEQTIAIGVELRAGARELQATRLPGDVVILIIPPSPPLGENYTTAALTLTARL